MGSSWSNEQDEDSQPPEPPPPHPGAQRQSSASRHRPPPPAAPSTPANWTSGWTDEGDLAQWVPNENSSAQQSLFPVFPSAKRGLDNPQRACAPNTPNPSRNLSFDTTLNATQDSVASSNNSRAEGEPPPIRPRRRRPGPPPPTVQITPMLPAKRLAQPQSYPPELLQTPAPSNISPTYSGTPFPEDPRATPLRFPTDHPDDSTPRTLRTSTLVRSSSGNAHSPSAPPVCYDGSSAFAGRPVPETPDRKDEDDCRPQVDKSSLVVECKGRLQRYNKKAEMWDAVPEAAMAGVYTRITNPDMFPDFASYSAVFQIQRARNHKVLLVSPVYSYSEDDGSMLFNKEDNSIDWSVEGDVFRFVADNAAGHRPLMQALVRHIVSSDYKQKHQKDLKNAHQTPNTRADGRVKELEDMVTNLTLAHDKMKDNNVKLAIKMEETVSDKRALEGKLYQLNSQIVNLAEEVGDRELQIKELRRIKDNAGIPTPPITPGYQELLDPRSRRPRNLKEALSELKNREDPTPKRRVNTGKLDLATALSELKSREEDTPNRRINTCQPVSIGSLDLSTPRQPDRKRLPMTSPQVATKGALPPRAPGGGAIQKALEDEMRELRRQNQDLRAENAGVSRKLTQLQTEKKALQRKLEDTNVGWYERENIRLEKQLTMAQAELNDRKWDRKNITRERQELELLKKHRKTKDIHVGRREKLHYFTHADTHEL